MFIIPSDLCVNPLGEKKILITVKKIFFNHFMYYLFFFVAKQSFGKILQIRLLDEQKLLFFSQLTFLVCSKRIIWIMNFVQYQFINVLNNFNYFCNKMRYLLCFSFIQTICLSMQWSNIAQRHMFSSSNLL